MLTKLLQGRSHVWSGALISAGIIMLFWLALAPSTSAHERLLKTETKFLAEHEDFVGAEPPVCDILDFDGPLKGEIFGETTSNSAEIRVTFDQFGCQIVGTLEILSTRFAGTGPFYGNIDGNYIRFTVTSETSDAPRDLNFGGLLDGDRIKGQYSIPHTDFVSEWHLSTGNSGPIARLTDLKDSVMDSGLIGEIRELEDELADLREREAELSSELELQFEA